MRYGRLVFGGLLLALSAPLGAQTATPAQEASPIDADRLAAARPVVDKLWPLGTYRRMMDGTLSKMMDQMLSSMYDMPASDFLGGFDKSGEAAKAADGKSMGELAATGDPHFRERMKLTMDAMFKEMIPLFEKVEPQVRASLANIYARRFTVAQLGDMNAFFATPTGKAYAEQSMLVYTDPEMIGAMQSFAPEMLRAMPEIMKKAEAATAHLPPPPKREQAGDKE